MAKWQTLYKEIIDIEDDEKTPIYVKVISPSDYDNDESLPFVDIWKKWISWKLLTR